jgi:hypothetical protein
MLRVGQRNILGDKQLLTMPLLDNSTTKTRISLTQYSKDLKWLFASSAARNVNPEPPHFLLPCSLTSSSLLIFPSPFRPSVYCSAVRPIGPPEILRSKENNSHAHL